MFSFKIKSQSALINVDYYYLFICYYLLLNHISYSYVYIYISTDYIYISLADWLPGRGHTAGFH